MRARLVNKDRIIESLDATLRDLEIRGCWMGLKISNLSYSEKINYMMNYWNVSIEAIEKAIYSDKEVISD